MAQGSSTPNIASTQSQGTSLTAAIQQALRNFELHSDQMLPAIVESYDRVKNVASIRPIIMWLDINDKQIRRKVINNVPVLSLGAGGFHISFPLKKGDLGWIYASDRDISLFKQNLKENPSNTGRLHSFADGMFIPEVLRNYVINAEDADAMVIQSVDGATRISIRGDNIKITAPVGVVIDTPKTTFTGDIEVQKNAKIVGNTEMDGNQKVTGMTTVNGGFSAAGGAGKACDLPATATVNGIVVANHGHTQQNNGVGRTAGGMTS